MAFKFLGIFKKNDLFKYLNADQRAQLGMMGAAIDNGRRLDGKLPASKNTYLVINTDEPYADEVIEILKRNGHWG
jgi:hypothetical protein